MGTQQPKGGGLRKGLPDMPDDILECIGDLCGSTQDYVCPRALPTCLSHISLCECAACPLFRFLESTMCLTSGHKNIWWAQYISATIEHISATPAQD